MVLIGKMANWLLRHSVQRYVKWWKSFCPTAFVLVDVDLP